MSSFLHRAFGNFDAAFSVDINHGQTQRIEDLLNVSDRRAIVSGDHGRLQFGNHFLRQRRAGEVNRFDQSPSRCDEWLTFEPRDNRAVLSACSVHRRGIRDHRNHCEQADNPH
jgi:hypothetical protein